MAFAPHGQRSVSRCEQRYALRRLYCIVPTTVLPGDHVATWFGGSLAPAFCYECEIERSHRNVSKEMTVQGAHSYALTSDYQQVVAVASLPDLSIRLSQPQTYDA